MRMSSRGYVNRRSRRRAVTVAAAVVGAAAVAITVPALSASAAVNGQGADRHTVYVAPHGTAGAHDTSCWSAAFNSISSAVSAVPAGGTVVACQGTYNEGVTIAKPLSLESSGRVVIDAANQVNGILIVASHVTVSGLTVTGATGEGILVNDATRVTLSHVVVAGNDRGGVPGGVTTSYLECQSNGGVPGDCGEGIHLMGATYSAVIDSVSTGNTGGILISDETGPSAHNTISGNRVTGNVYDCGITVVGHNPAAAPNGVPAPTVAGVFDNVIAGNVIEGNGTQGDGAGVILATPFPGGAVYNNVVEGNRISGNGLSGVTLHSHAPGQDMNGNVVRDNWIGVNNLDGDQDFAAADISHTGVFAGTVSPVSFTVTGNVIAGDYFGIWTTGPVALNQSHNEFVSDTVPVGQG